MLPVMTAASDRAVAVSPRRALWFWTGAVAALAAVITKPTGPINLIVAVTLIAMAAVWSRGRGFATFPAGVALTVFVTFVWAEIHDHGLTLAIAIVIAGVAVGLSAVACAYLLTRRSTGEA